MKFSLNWLKEYVDIKNPRKTAEDLTMSIAEVEKIEKQGKGLEGVFVGEILEIKKHPNADKLSVAKINIGKKVIQVIFGQVVSLKVGDRLPIALAPTILPSGLKIEKKKLRGIESEGMCCLNSELGILDKARRVIFFKDTPVGTPIAKAFSLDDVIFDIDNKSLTHRYDLLSHIGIAREISAKKNKKLTLPKIAKLKIPSKAKKFIIEVKDKELCPRYMAIQLDNIKIGPSPKWMQSRLNSAGMRPINNVVDITNYMMLEYGQPLHAFDCDKITKQQDNKAKIIIRRAKIGEFIITIDGKRRQLDNSMLIIADEKKPIAIAGVMGGIDSEVLAKTTSIILESANFNAYSVRQTVRKLGIHSEATTRFEKRIAVELPSVALVRAVNLFQNICNATIASKIADQYFKKQKQKKINLNLGKLEKFLGTKISANKIKSILKSLEFKVNFRQGSKSDFGVEAPYFRNDIHIAEDIYEEVARIYGYDNIKPQEIEQIIKPVLIFPDLYWRTETAKYLADWGFSEVYNYSFLGAKLLAKCGLTPKNHIILKNPQSPDMKFLRTSLLPRLLENVEKNSRQSPEIKIFEIGKVFMPGCESKMLSGIICSNKKGTFYKAKGIVELLLEKLNIDFKFSPLVKTSNCEYWNLYRQGHSLQIKSGDRYLGAISKVDRQILDNFDLEKKHISFFDLFFEEIAKLAGKPIKFKPLSKYPPISLDLAFVVGKKIPARDIEKEIYDAGRPLLADLELFDVYEGKPLLPNEKNLAFHLIYRAENRTLKDEDVKIIQEKIIRVLENKFKAKIRKF